MGLAATATQAVAGNVPLLGAGASGARPPGAGDVMALKVLSSTPIVTTPTNLIDPNGRILAITIKGVSTGLTFDHTQLSLTVSYPGYDSTGAATTVSETVRLNSRVREPFPKAWASGETVTTGASDLAKEWRANRVSSQSRIYRCTTAGGGTTSVAPTHTASIGQKVTGADGYEWEFLGYPGHVSGTPKKYMETISGSDIIVYGWLEKSIPSGATITSWSAGANLYGSSNACSSSSVAATITHSQTLLAPQPYVVPLTKARQLVTDVIRLESTVYAHGWQQQRPSALHNWLIYDSSKTLVATVSVTAAGRSTLLTGGNIVQNYGYSFSTVTAGLADGDYYIQEQDYPWRGRAWLSDTHGIGTSLASASTTVALTANVGKWIPFTKKASPTLRYGYVDGTGVGSPAVDTDPAVARTKQFATVYEAASALQTANGGTLDSTCIIRIMDKGSNYAAGFHTSLNLQSLTYGKTPLIIEIDPLATPGSVNFQPGSALATARKQGPLRCIWRGLKFTYDATNGAPIDNVAGSTVGDFTIEQAYEDCTLTGKGSNPAVARPGLIPYIYNSTITLGTNFGTANTRTAFKVMGGCQVQGGASDTTIGAIAWIGNICTSNGSNFSPTPAAPDAQRWAEGTGSQTNNQFTFFMFNSWPICRRTSGIATNNGTGTAAVDRGSVFSHNLVEVADADSNGSADSKGGTYSGDGNVIALPEFHCSWNTWVGDGPNLLYNETGSTLVAKYMFGGFNVGHDINHKGDYYESGVPHRDKCGNASVRNHVDFGFNFYPGTAGTSFDQTPSPSNNAGDAWSRSDLVKPTSTALNCDFVLDRCFLAATKTGNGNYRPTGSNACIGMITSTALQMFPEDLGGNTRVSGGAPGAYEYA